MNRREFVLAVSGSLLTSTARSDDVPRELRITRVVGFESSTHRAKLAGKNARLDVHGHGLMHQQAGHAARRNPILP